MKQDALFDALTNIDDELILQAHETPTPHRIHHPLRRTAAVIAAVTALVAMTIVVAADRSDNKFNLPGYPMEGYVWYSTESPAYKWSDKTICYHADTLPVELNSLGNPQSFSSSYSAEQVKSKLMSHGETLKLNLEEMVLMADGEIKYKKADSIGTDIVVGVIDNSVEGETGTIVHVRLTFSAFRNGQWEQLYQYTEYLPNVLDLDVPYGTDVRFPDMQYNYDGRYEPEEAQAPLVVREEPEETVTTEPIDGK